jgi:hypothetical protein
MNPPHKTCTKCHLLKSLGEFNNDPKSSDGKTWYCKACIKAYNATRATKPKTVPVEKSCTKCDAIKAIDEFGLDKNTKDGHATRCLLCKCAESEVYRGKNPEKVRAATAKWDAENPEKNKAWRETNKEKRSQQRKARYAADPAKENAQTSLYYFASKDKLRPKRRAWDAAHPEFTREKAQRRRANEAQVPVNDFTGQQWQEVQELQKHRCYYCGKRCKGKLTRDHLTPISKNGSNTLHNIIAVCNKCNSKKRANKPPVPVQPFLLLLAPAKPVQPRKKRGK